MCTERQDERELGNEKEIGVCACVRVCDTEKTRGTDDERFCFIHSEAD